MDLNFEQTTGSFCTDATTEQVTEKQIMDAIRSMAGFVELHKKHPSIIGGRLACVSEESAAAIVMAGHILKQLATAKVDDAEPKKARGGKKQREQTKKKEREPTDEAKFIAFLDQAFQDLNTFIPGPMTTSFNMYTQQDVDELTTSPGGVQQGHSNFHHAGRSTIASNRVALAAGYTQGQWIDALHRMIGDLEHFTAHTTMMLGLGYHAAMRWRRFYQVIHFFPSLLNVNVSPSTIMHFLPNLAEEKKRWVETDGQFKTAHVALERLREESKTTHLQVSVDTINVESTVMEEVGTEYDVLRTYDASYPMHDSLATMTDATAIAGDALLAGVRGDIPPVQQHWRQYEEARVAEDRCRYMSAPEDQLQTQQALTAEALGRFEHSLLLANEVYGHMS